MVGRTGAFILLVGGLLPCAAVEADYWQQEAHYDIEVTLNDTTHTLHAIALFTYVNHSPDTLRQLYFHAYPNAFRDNNTPYAREQLQAGNPFYLLAPEKHRGYLLITDIRTPAGTPLPWEELPDSPDIVRVALDKPLPPEDTIQLSIRFTVKLPYPFSRIGHDSNAYYTTQWYPRIAVYDREGWHLYPYRDIGEYYGEYGTFRVRLTLPSNYVVLATGTLTTPQEKEWLKQRALHTLQWMAFMDTLKQKSKKAWKDSLKKAMTFPPSSQQMKTIEFYAENVHDFAFFADKRYLIKHDTIHLPGRSTPVEIWTAFLPASYEVWRSSDTIVAVAVRYYSQRVGTYPYPTAQAVEGILLAGGGMEYPMITIVSTGIRQKLALAITILHEVGHNWFQGILGFDERHYPWMDEGINSYYEMSDTTLKNLFANKIKRKARGLFSVGRNFANLLTNEYLRSIEKDLPLTLPAEAYPRAEYGILIYMRTPLYLKFIEGWLGEQVLDSAMHLFYHRWQFKHPRPEHLWQTLEEVSGKSLDWAQNLWNTSHFPDLKIEAVDREPVVYAGKDTFLRITVKSKNGIETPFIIAGLDSRRNLVAHTWYDPMAEGEVLFRYGQLASLVINPTNPKTVLQTGYFLPDQHPHDNYWHLRFTPKNFITIKPFFVPVWVPSAIRLGWLPLLNWNETDGLQAGIALHNLSYRIPRTELAAVALLGFKSLSPVFYGRLMHWIHINAFGIKWLGLGAEGWGATISLTPEKRRYTRIAPTAQLSFTTKNTRQLRSLTIQGVWIEEDLITNKQQAHLTLISQYTQQVRGKLNPSKLSLRAEAGSGYTKLTTTYTLGITYDQKGNAFYIRLFGGWLPTFIREKLLTNPTLRLSSYTYAQDYLYSHWYLTRSPSSLNNILARHIYPEEGGFTLATFAFATEWMGTLGLAVDMPVKFPLRLYANAGIIKDRGRDAEPLVWEAGIRLGWDGFAVYMPLALHTALREAWCQQMPLDVCPFGGDRLPSPTIKEYLNRITFELNLNIDRLWFSLRHPPF